MAGYPIKTLAHTAPTVGTSSGAVLAANDDRSYVKIINDSDTVIYLKVGVAAVLNEGIRVEANGGAFDMSADLGNLDTRAINGISSGASKVMLASEG